MSKLFRVSYSVPSANLAPERVASSSGSFFVDFNRFDARFCFDDVGEVAGSLFLPVLSFPRSVVLGATLSSKFCRAVLVPWFVLLCDPLTSDFLPVELFVYNFAPLVSKWR